MDRDKMNLAAGKLCGWKIQNDEGFWRIYKPCGARMPHFRTRIHADALFWFNRSGYAGDYCASLDTCRELIQKVCNDGKLEEFQSEIWEIQRQQVQSEIWHMIAFSEPEFIVEAVLRAYGKYEEVDV